MEFSRRIIMYVSRRTNTHTFPLAEKFSRGVLSAQNTTLIFPLPATVPSKLLGQIFEKLRHGPEIRHFVWPRGRRDCSMARG